MPGRVAVRVHPFCRFAAVYAFVLLSAAAPCGRGQDVLPTSGMDTLNSAHKRHKELANDLLRGIRVAELKDPTHIEALDTEAKYVTYQFTWVTVQQSAGEIGKVYTNGVETDVKFLLKGRPGTTNAIQIFAAKATEHALEVLKTKPVIARVNAARVLAKLAELAQPDLCDALVGLIQDPQELEAVKFYAARGLRELAIQQPPVLSAEYEKKAAEALAAFIDRNMTVSPDTTRREDAEGFRYVRREAVRALAQFRNPGAAARGRSGIMLLRVVAKDGLVPPPRIDERVEAAIGVARLKSALDKQYNPDYAIAQLGLFLDDFNREGSASGALQKDIHYYPIFPWRIMASRLYEAIEQMRQDSGDSAYVVRLSGVCLKLLEQLEKGDPADAEEILRVVATSPPPSGRLYKDVEDSTVRPANRRLEPNEAPLAAQLQTKPPVPPGADGKPPAPPGADGKPPAPPPPGAAGKPGAPPSPPPAKAPPGK